MASYVRFLIKKTLKELKVTKYVNLHRYLYSHGPLEVQSAQNVSKNIKPLENLVSNYFSLKGVSSKPSGNLIVAPIFCFLS